MVREDEVIHYTEKSWKAFKDSVWKEAQQELILQIKNEFPTLDDYEGIHYENNFSGVKLHKYLDTKK